MGVNTAILNWSLTDKGIEFSLLNPSGSLIPVDQWGLFPVSTSNGQSGSVAVLLGLIEDEVAHVDKGDVVHLGFRELAAFDELELKQLGLPIAAPFRLKIRGVGILTSARFRFEHQLIKGDGSPVMGASRLGSIISVGHQQYSLLDPLYSLIVGMDEFNSMPPDQMDDRMLAWAGLKELLPDDALVDNQLRSLNIVRADSFTLDIDDRGNINPQLLSRSGKLSDELPDPSISSVPILPSGPQGDFEKRFLTQPRAMRRYTTAGNWFVVLPPKLQKVLQVVRDQQNADVSERRAFIANPTAVFTDRLQDQLSEAELSEVFEETPEFLSARVSHLGQWEPKKCAYALPSGQQWFPEDVDGFGVIIGERLYPVKTEDVEGIFNELLKAANLGQASIEYQGVEILVSDESISTFERLNDELKHETATRSNAESRTEVGVDKAVPILIDNIEELGYQPDPRPIRGAPGGLPAVLETVSLYNHQREGLRWLQEHWASGSSGALLADDMGLGKTLQTLAFFAWVQEQMEAGHCRRMPLLIVAPTGLLKNWEDESKMHLGGLRLGKLYKAFGHELSELKNMTHLQRKAELERADWVLTTYETLRDKIRYFLPVDWAVVAFDEVQKIKNPTARMTEMAKSLRSEFVIALTGTPVENRLVDLWSIIDTVAPGLLGSMKEFRSRYESQGNSRVTEALTQLRFSLTESPKPSRLLRRLKSDHLKGLPQKEEIAIRREMPASQSEIYETLINSVKGRTGQKGVVLETLQAIRKVSLLPFDIGEEGLTDETIKESARLSALIEILDQIHEKQEKALIFIEFLKLQDALIPFLQNRYQMDWPPLRISGSVPGHIRKNHVDKFQKRGDGIFDLMLLSPKAGGVGLTLTAANNVVHLSRWWNPAVEDQCTDRVYRIGQTRQVNVYLPLAIHPRYQEKSFDINLNSLLDRKRQLSRDALAPVVASEDDLHTLLSESVDFK